MEQEKFSKIVWIVVEKLISSRPRTLTDFLLVISKISATLTSSFIISSPCLRTISLIVFIYLFFRKGFALSKVLSVGHSTISCNTFQLLFYLLFSYLNVFVSNLGLKLFGVRVFLLRIKTDRKNIRNYVLNHYFSRKDF